MTISLNQQLEEIERELTQRTRVYPRLVSRGQLRESVGKYQQQRLFAAGETIRFLNKHRDAFVAFAKLYEFEVK
jgi:hypothetical protein